MKKLVLPILLVLCTCSFSGFNERKVLSIQCCKNGFFGIVYTTDSISDSMHVNNCADEIIYSQYAPPRVRNLVFVHKDSITYRPINLDFQDDSTDTYKILHGVTGNITYSNGHKYNYVWYIIGQGKCRDSLVRNTGNYDRLIRNYTDSLEYNREK